MSLIAYTWAWNQRGLDPTAKLVLMHLADAHNGQSCQCNPRIDRIAEYCEVSTRTVQRHLQGLRDRGLISIDEQILPGGQRSNLYVLRGDNLSPRSADHPDTGDQTGVTPVTDHPDTGVTPTEPEYNRNTNREPISPHDSDGRDRSEDIFDGDPEPDRQPALDDPPVAGLDYLVLLNRSIKWTSRTDHERAAAETEVAAKVAAYGLDTIREAAALWLKCHARMPWLWEVDDAVTDLKQSSRMPRTPPPGQAQDLPDWAQPDDD